MALAAGTKLGQYEVLAQIGSGGMGEVYRALDTVLKREVALKLLPEIYARDPDRLARFRREAELLASLNHPNIAAIYGVYSEGSRNCLVMELVEGETLAEQVRRGPVEIEEALQLCSQICEALEHAHEKNIIHRDLKPANVKVTPEGKVKVLGFGLAKAFAGDGGASGTPTPVIDSNSPTLSRMPSALAQPPMENASPTLPGVILGTAAYMSPEQAKGKTVDKRADIWALGAVLYELLTGHGAFHRLHPSRARQQAVRSPLAKPPLPPGRGSDDADADDEPDTVQEIIARVLQAEPDWAALPEATPASIRALLRRCLRKDPQQRPRDAADIRLELDDARAAAAPSASTVIVQAPAPAPRRWLLLGALACIGVATVASLATWYLRPAPAAPERPVERVVSALPANTTLPLTNVGVLALSPDGRRLAYVATGSGSGQQLYLRAMDALEAAPLAGTEGAISPFFSPDGEWIGFATGGILKKISASGGTALTLCNLSSGFRGGTWGPDNTIVFASGNTVALMKVSAAGGEPQPFSNLQQGESSHRWPQFLPDGKTILFTIGSTGNYDDAQIVVQRLDSGERKVLIRGGTYARYVPTGHLVYYRAGTIMAVPFDPVALEVKGSASPVVEAVSGDISTGAAQFSVSDFGSLAYLSGGPQTVTRTMAWVNRQGVATPLPAPPRAYRAPRLSPDGRQLALGIGADVWIYDIARDTPTRFTFEGNNTNTAALWAPDGKRVVFPTDRAGPINLFWMPVDGSGPEERLTTSPNAQSAGTISPDGRTIVYGETNPKTFQDMWVLPMEADPRQVGSSPGPAVGAEARKPRIFLQGPFSEYAAQFSPDGRWIAYSSNESGRLEVYVRPFPGPGGKWQISTEGGAEFAWSPKGNELFYRTGPQREKMMVVEYQTQPTFSASRPRLLFEGNYVAQVATSPAAYYSVSPDGQRFLMMEAPEQTSAALTQINVVLNWFEELKQKVPVK